MKSSINKGLTFISILLMFSLGIAFAEASKDMAITTSPKNITNTTKNITNATPFKNPIKSGQLTRPRILLIICL